MPEIIHISQQLSVFGLSAGMGVRGKGTAFESSWPRSVLERPFRFCEAGFPAAWLPHGLAAEIDTEGIVYEPVENAVGYRRITDLLVPVLHWHLRSQNRGAALIPVVADFQKIAALGIFERRHAEVIEHQHIDFREL